MCFLSLGSGCFLKFLSSNPGQDICIPVWFLRIDGSYSVNEAIWDGGGKERMWTKSMLYVA